MVDQTQVELPRLLLLDEGQELRLGPGEMLALAGDLVCRDDEGALGAVVCLLVLLKEGLQLEVHARDGNHVNVRYEGVVSLTASLDSVPQQVLRVGVRLSPAHHLLVSPLQQSLQDQSGLPAVQLLLQLLPGEVMLDIF